MRNSIEEYRKPLGLSQYRLGKKIGVSRISINKIEIGKTAPSLKTANALGVCIYHIFDLDSEETYKCKSNNCYSEL